MELPYIEPAFGKHALPVDRERNREDAVHCVSAGLRILPGWGKHRSSRYSNGLFAPIPYESREVA